MKTAAFFCIASVIFFSGCANESPEEFDRLVKEDPVFRQMIVARDQARRGIQVIRDDLLKKKNGVNAQVSALHRDYDAYAQVQNAKISRYQAEITNARERMRRELESDEAQCQAKETELEGYRKTLVDVQRVLKESKGIRFSKEEIRKWDEKVLMLSEKMRPLEEEIADLRLKIRLKKKKMHFLN